MKISIFLIVALIAFTTEKTLRRRKNEEEVDKEIRAHTLKCTLYKETDEVCYDNLECKSLHCEMNSYPSKRGRCRYPDGKRRSHGRYCTCDEQCNDGICYAPGNALPHCAKYDPYAELFSDPGIIMD